MAEFHTKDTIIAPATIAGTGAISLIRISGPAALEAGSAIVRLRSGSLSDSPVGRVRFGTIYDSGSILDEVVCYSFRAPHSYTGEDSVEICCHASSYIVSRILEMAVGLGCRMAEPGEFTRRAYLNGKMDLAQAEAVADLISSSSEASHRVAMSQMRGGFSSELRDLRSQLLEMTALLELELDFSEEEVEFADRKKLKEILSLILNKISGLISSFKLGNAIKNGVPVAIVGAANSGKSTLLNAILGEQRAIVSDVAGTTRDTIEETFNVGGVLFRFVDTAGIRRQVSDKVEKLGIERSMKSLSLARLVLLVIDASSETEDGLLNEIISNIDFSSQRLLLVINKSDLIGENKAKEVVSGLISCLNNFVQIQNSSVKTIDTESVFIISALSGTGVEELKEKLSALVKSQLSGLSDDSVLVTNIRHYQALVQARNALLPVQSGLASGTPSDLVAADLRAVLSTLGSITGEISSDEVLGEIFAKFCIGK